VPEMLTIAASSAARRVRWVPILCCSSSLSDSLPWSSATPSAWWWRFDEPVPGRTRIVVHGTARRAVRKAFVNLGADAGPAPR
jgi:hypothetical protein